jgi:DNA-directed RNA polymerase specialized sigma24 family protein
VTKNRVLDELRSIERRPRSVVNIDDMTPLESIDAPFERAETIDALWRAVESLNIDLKMASSSATSSGSRTPRSRTHSRSRSRR